MSLEIEIQNFVLTFIITLSNYPEKRVTKDSSGNEMGVAGNMQLLQNVGLSTQPLSSFDWSPDKVGLAVSTAFDQTLRVIVVTKLNTI
jgi:hypothetical protein